MQVSGCNQVNYNQGHPSFQMKLKCNKGSDARKVFDAGIKDFYDECFPVYRMNYFEEKPLDVNLHFKRLKNAFEKITNQVKDETVEIVVDKSAPALSNDCVRLRYTDKRGLTFLSERPIRVSDFTSNKGLDNGKPYTSAAKRILANITDAAACKGIPGNNENSNAYVLLKNMLD